MLISDWLARQADTTRRRCRPGQRWDDNKKRCVRVSLKQRAQEKRVDREKNKARRHTKTSRRRKRGLRRLGMRVSEWIKLMS